MPPPSADEYVVHGQLSIRSVREEDVLVVALFGELDLASAGHLEDVLLDAERGDAEEIVLDLGGLQFMDSTGLRTILSAAARSRSDGDRLRVLRGPDEVQRVFELTGVATRLPFAD